LTPLIVGNDYDGRRGAAAGFGGRITRKEKKEKKNEPGPQATEPRPVRLGTV
jgi:hypothetical protein